MAFLYNMIIMTHGSLIFVKVLRIYNSLYFLPLYHFSHLFIVWKDLYVAKWPLGRNERDATLEILRSSETKLPILGTKLPILGRQFQNERTVRYKVKHLDNASISRHFVSGVDISRRLLPLQSLLSVWMSYNGQKLISTVDQSAASAIVEII